VTAIITPAQAVNRVTKYYRLAIRGQHESAEIVQRNISVQIISFNLLGHSLHYRSDFLAHGTAGAFVETD
jgi:hypothetical protein